MWNTLLAPTNSSSARLWAGDPLSVVFPEHFTGESRVVDQGASAHGGVVKGVTGKNGKIPAATASKKRTGK
jgi:hypothetical protein